MKSSMLPVAIVEVSREAVTSKFGAKLREARTLRGYPMTIFSNLVGRDRSACTRWESGMKNVPLAQIVTTANVLAHYIVFTPSGEIEFIPAEEMKV